MLLIVRLLPVIFLLFAATIFVLKIEAGVAYPFRNLLPMLATFALALTTLIKGRGSWTGAGWQWPLGTLGFAVPAVGLSLYLHYGHSVDLDGMVSESIYPYELFRYLPAYTMVAGGIGFLIGWIVGRNVDLS